MPPKRRKGHKRSRAAYNDGHAFQLQHGHLYEFLGEGFGEGQDFDWEAAEEAWPVLRPEIMLEHLKLFPGRRPWAFWKFEMGRDPPPNEDQPRILHRLGLLSKPEKAKLSNRPQSPLLGQREG